MPQRGRASTELGAGEGLCMWAKGGRDLRGDDDVRTLFPISRKFGARGQIGQDSDNGARSPTTPQSLPQSLMSLTCSIMDTRFVRFTAHS